MFLRKVTAFLTVAVMLCSFAGCSASDEKSPTVADSPVAGKKVAYIMQMASSDIFQMWSDAAEETAEGLGMEFQAFFCDGSDEKWQETARQCAADGYDGLLLSHGGQSYAYKFLKDLTEQYPDLKIVTFDTLFEDSSGRTQKIEGVTQFFQQDSQLAELLLDYICNTLYADKTDAGEPVNILKVWEGPQFLSSFDRRQEGYARYEEQGLIRTVETIGPDDHSNAESSIAEAMTDVLASYEEGEIDAIWCCYDLYARGVYDALKKSNADIPMVSVDICNADIEKMAEETSPWKACATSNWSYNGEFGMRVLALELAGEYDKILDPMTGQASGWLELPVSLVTQDMVSEGDVDVTNLETVAGAAYSDRSWMPVTDWMTKFLGN